MKQPTIRPKLRASKRSTHEVLVNKKTGKVSSINNEMNILSVKVFLSGDSVGIMQRFYTKGRNLFKSNTIQPKPKRTPKGGNLNQIIQRQAQELIVGLAVLYDLERPQHLTPSRIKFARWIPEQLYDPNSESFHLAKERGYFDLLETSRGIQWWLQQLKKFKS